LKKYKFITKTETPVYAFQSSQKLFSATLAIFCKYATDIKKMSSDEEEADI